jgi:hypothetical protein
VRLPLRKSARTARHPPSCSPSPYGGPYPHARPWPRCNHGNGGGAHQHPQRRQPEPAWLCAWAKQPTLPLTRVYRRLHAEPVLAIDPTDNPFAPTLLGKPSKTVRTLFDPMLMRTERQGPTSWRCGPNRPSTWRGAAGAAACVCMPLTATRCVCPPSALPSVSCPDRVSLAVPMSVPLLVALATGQLLSVVESSNDEGPTCAAASSDGSLAATGTRTGTIKVHHTQSCICIHVSVSLCVDAFRRAYARLWGLHHAEAGRAAGMGDGARPSDRGAAAAAAYVVRPHWSHHRLVVRRARVGPHAGSAESAAALGSFCAEYSLLVSGASGLDCTCIVWDTNAYAPVRTLPRSPGPVVAIAVSATTVRQPPTLGRTHTHTHTFTPSPPPRVHGGTRLTDR